MTLLEPLFKVKVVEIDTGKIEREIAGLSEWKAEKLVSGLNINLNHERFYVDVVEYELEETNETHNIHYPDALEPSYTNA